MSARGFTLVELLVAVCIASIAIAGGISTLSHVHAAWSAAQEQQRLHERALYALATLAPDIQMAGFFGSGPAPALEATGALPESMRSCGMPPLRIATGIEVLGGPWPLACGSLGGGSIADGPVLLLRRASAGIATPESGRVQLLDSQSAPALRQWRWDGAAPPGAAGQPDLQWRDLLLRVYYIARQSDGDPATPALRVKNLTAVAGSPAFIDTEVMPGVTHLSVELLPDPAHPTAARVTLIVQADAGHSGGGNPPPRLAITRDFALRNAPQG